MEKSTIGERIRARRKELKMKQSALGKAAGVSGVSISMWERGDTKPTGENLLLLANALQCKPQFLMYGGEDGDNNVEFVKFNHPKGRYPLISWVSAGSWAEAVEPYALEEIDKWYESDTHIEGPAFWLRVEGDSMTAPYGLSIPQGMLILIDTGREAKNGSLVVAKLTDANEATFKKLVIDSGLGKRYLQPLNPNQPRIEIDGNCKIIGVAIEQRGSLI